MEWWRQLQLEIRAFFCYTFISASISGKRDRCIYEFAGGWPTCCDTHPILFYTHLEQVRRKKNVFSVEFGGNLRDFLIARVAIRITFLKVAP